MISPQKWNRAVRYAIAPVAVALSLVCRLALNPFLHDSSPFMYFYVAIIVSVWLGGLGPGLTATVLSMLSVDYFYSIPIGSVLRGEPEPIIQSISFLILGAAVSVIATRMRRERRRDKQATREARAGETEARTDEVDARAGETEARRAEAASRESEERFRGTFENAGVGMTHLDLNGNWLRVNQSFCDLLGYSREELEGKNYWELTHPGDVGKDEETYAQFIRGNIDYYNLEKRYITKDGREVWVYVNRALQRDSEGKPLYTTTNVVNITERKRMEDELRQSEARFRGTFENSAIGMTHIDLNGNWLLVNQRFCDLLGYTREELEGKKYWDLTHPDDIEKDVAPYTQLIRGNIDHYDVEKRYISKDGRVIWVYVNRALQRDSDGKPLYSITNTVDITDRKRIEEALRQNEERLRATFNNAAVGIVETDAQDRFVAVNERVCQILGYCRDKLLGMSVHELTAPEDRSRSDELNAQLHAGRMQQIDYEKRYLRQDGSPLWVHVTVAAVHDCEGRYLHSINTIEDISKRKQIEEELKQNTERLIDADRRKDEFMAMLAHELRNPLAPIRYATQMLKMNGLAQDQIQKQHELIDRQVSHMGRLLDDLLEVSRITRGKIQLKREIVDLRTVATQALDSMRPMIEGRGQHLAYEEPGSPLPVDGDPMRLEQIIRNLLHNANKYTEAGGCIKLSLGLETENAHAWRSVVRVIDSGIGIDPEMLPHVFELFAQAAQALDRTQGGLGIGLAMVKNLVQMHGGSVEAHSAGLGRGSEFVLRLPLTDGVLGGLKEVSALDEQYETAPSKPRRVLVVDDSADATASLGELLSLWGHEVQTAHDGSHALVAARKWQPEIILLDIGLPGMDGYEVARRLREDPATSSAFLVALTGYGQEEDRRRSLEAGFNQHLTKPVELVLLQDIFHKDITI